MITLQVASFSRKEWLKKWAQIVLGENLELRKWAEAAAQIPDIRAVLFPERSPSFSSSGLQLRLSMVARLASYPWVYRAYQTIEATPPFPLE